jgi:hypothetical protein
VVVKLAPTLHHALSVIHTTLRKLTVNALLVVLLIPIMSQEYVKIAIQLAIIVLVLLSINVHIVTIKFIIKDSVFQAAHKNLLIRTGFV